MRVSSHPWPSFVTLSGLALAGLLAACTADGPEGGPGSPDGGGQAPPPGDDCDAVGDWPATSGALEAQVLDLVNQQRSQGADCGSEGLFGPAEPLVQHPVLGCVARAHSLDMYERDFFDHTNPDGEKSWERMERAGYSYSQAGENIASGATTSDAVMQQWMGSDVHCANIMSPAFVHIGIGYHADGRLWTQVFGAPR